MLLAVTFFAVLAAGCGGGSDSPDSEQTETLSEDIGEYDPNEESRGNSDSVREVNLSMISTDYTAQSGETLKGTLRADVKISIAHGATITIKDVTINGVNSSSYNWAGLNCLGDATIILEGTNTIKGFYEDYPGIRVSENNTLTIKGNGSLTASSNGFGAGIGGGFYLSCGNITISGGTITATGRNCAAGIGGGDNASCGSITISGGTITAKGGYWAAGIDASNVGSCEDITISGGTVDATSGKSAAAIGVGLLSSCGNITITGTETKVKATGSGDNSILCSFNKTITIGDQVKERITDNPFYYPDPQQ